MKRLMRLRQSALMRDLCAETEWNTSQLVQPLFAVEGISKDEEIPGLKGVLRQTTDSLLRQIESDLKLGVRQFLLFPVPEKKALKDFSHQYSSDVIVKIKKRFGSDLNLWVDTCLCSQTEHGHCGVIQGNHFDSQTTLKELSRSALSFAQAGADGVAPSDMMDGRTKAIRNTLDENQFSLVPIMSYSTKFSSQFYGPFRVAASSSPKFGDRKSYQIDVRNRSDAMASSVRCAEEGADLLMVKPGMSAIDLILPIAEKTGLQVGAYQVSAEFASLVLLEEKGLINFDLALLESWHVFKRAGAQFIITYGAREAKRLGVKVV